MHFNFNQLSGSLIKNKLFMLKIKKFIRYNFYADPQISHPIKLEFMSIYHGTFIMTLKILYHL